MEAPINVYQYKPAGDVNETKTMTARFMMQCTTMMIVMVMVMVMVEMILLMMLQRIADDVGD